VTRDVNESLANESDSQALMDIQRRLHVPNSSKFELFTPGRRLVKQGEILKHSRKEVQARYLLLVSVFVNYVDQNSVLKFKSVVLLSIFIIRQTNETLIAWV